MIGWKKRIVFAIVAAALVFIASGLLVLATDIYLHKKYEKTASVNVWGYRGPTVGRKAEGEVRVVVLGGSTAFGYGPDWDGSFPYLLEQRLNAGGNGRFSVVNLAYNNEDAYAFRYTMEDYEYLEFDIAIMYEGYNDLSPRPRYQVYRRESPIFRLTGYLPIFQIVAKEKAWAMMGNINRGYIGSGQTEKPIVFRPNIATQAAAKALETAAVTTESLERQLGRLTRDAPVAHPTTSTNDCGDRWQHYCGAVYDAIAWARARRKGVLVGTQPYVFELHIEQQDALAAMLQQRFGNDLRVRHVNLGNSVDLKDPRLTYDGMHLLAAGNQIIADGFAQPVFEMAARLER